MLSGGATTIDLVASAPQPAIFTGQPVRNAADGLIGAILVGDYLDDRTGTIKASLPHDEITFYDVNGQVLATSLPVPAESVADARTRWEHEGSDQPHQRCRAAPHRGRPRHRDPLALGGAHNEPRLRGDGRIDLPAYWPTPTSCASSWSRSFWPGYCSPSRSASGWRAASPDRYTGWLRRPGWSAPATSTIRRW